MEHQRQQPERLNSSSSSSRRRNNNNNSSTTATCANRADGQGKTKRSQANWAPSCLGGAAAALAPLPLLFLLFFSFFFAYFVSVPSPPLTPGACLLFPVVLLQLLPLPLLLLLLCLLLLAVRPPLGSARAVRQLAGGRSATNTPLVLGGGAGRGMNLANALWASLFGACQLPAASSPTFSHSRSHSRQSACLLASRRLRLWPGGGTSAQQTLARRPAQTLLPLARPAPLLLNVDRRAARTHSRGQPSLAAGALAQTQSSAAAAAEAQS